VFAATVADLTAARTQMALSLGWHIVIASFGVGMPAVTVFTEWRGLRTGDRVYTALAHTWAKAMGVLFAVGAVSGTILSFEMGLLWPELMGRFGDVIGLPFALEGIAAAVWAATCTRGTGCHPGRMCCPASRSAWPVWPPPSSWSRRTPG
jgi:cytochrome bd ubiquinol oxidase subunit I